MPTVGAVVKVEKLEGIAFYEEICKAHISMNEPETLAGFAISGHSCANTRLSALKKTPFLGDKVCEVTPVAPGGVRAKRGVTVPDRTGDGQCKGAAGSGSHPENLVMLTRCNGGPEAARVLMQRSGKRSEATEEAAHRLPIPLVGSYSIHIYKGNSMKYIAIG